MAGQDRIRLVQDDGRHPLEFALGELIQNPARSADDQSRALGHLGLLLSGIGRGHQSSRVDARMLVAVGDALGLQRELGGRREDQTATAVRRPQPLQNRQQIGECFAGAGSGLDDHMLPGQDRSDGRLLNCGRRGDPVGLECGQQRLIDFQSSCSKKRLIHRRLLAPPPARPSIPRKIVLSPLPLWPAICERKANHENAGESRKFGPRA